MTLPDDFIDADIQGRDRQLLEAFYGGRMANPYGGTAHEMNLRGLHAVLALAAADRPAAVAPEAPRRPRYTRHYADGSWQGADHPGGPWRSIPAPQSRLPWSVDPAAAGQRQTLILVVQAVLDAANGASSFGPDDWLYDAREVATATIRALVDHVVPAQLGLMHPVARAEATNIRAEILAIAAELEGADG